jgi:hypothetical protein
MPAAAEPAKAEPEYELRRVSAFPAARVSRSRTDLGFFFDVMERRDPGANYVGGVTWTKKLLTPVKDAVIMFMSKGSQQAS